MTNVYIPTDRPVYQLSSACFLNNELIPEEKVIFWNGEPNLEMVPMNKLAEEKFEEYINKLDKLGAQAASKAGKEYHSIKDFYIKNKQNADENDLHASPVLGAKGQIPLLGGVKNAGVEKIEDKPKEAPLSLGKRAVNRTMNGEA